MWCSRTTSHIMPFHRTAMRAAFGSVASKKCVRERDLINSFLFLTKLSIVAQRVHVMHQKRDCRGSTTRQVFFHFCVVDSAARWYTSEVDTRRRRPGGEVAILAHKAWMSQRPPGSVPKVWNRLWNSQLPHTAGGV
jgi:hypothetical protein